jgi:hypothetical protein
MAPQSDAKPAGDRRTTSATTREDTRRPGVVRLLEKEPTPRERASHAAKLLWLYDRSA